MPCGRAAALQQRGGDVHHRGAGRQPRDQEQRAQDGAVPQRPRDHGVEQDAGVDAQADAQHDVGPAQRSDPRRPGDDGVGQRLQHRHGAAQPGPGVGQADQRRDQQHAVDDDQHPRAPGHRRADLERGEDAPDVQPVREVEQQRQHADVHQHEAEQRRLHGEEAAWCPRPLATRSMARPRQHHHAGDDAAEEEVQRNLPAPDRQVRVDQRVVSRAGDLEHGELLLRSGRRCAAGCRPRAAACGSGACAAASLTALFGSSRSPKCMQCVGHTETQAGSMPSFTRCTQKVHLST